MLKIEQEVPNDNENDRNLPAVAGHFKPHPFATSRIVVGHSKVMLWVSVKRWLCLFNSLRFCFIVPCIYDLRVKLSFIYIKRKCVGKLKSEDTKYKWATSEKVPSDIDAQRRLKSAYAAALSDQSSLTVRRNFVSLAILNTSCEDYYQAGSLFTQPDLNLNW